MQPSAVMLTVPAAYLAAFALAFLAACVGGLVIGGIIAVRFARLDEHVKTALVEHRDMRAGLALLRDEVTAIRNERSEGRGNVRVLRPQEND